MGGGVAGPSTAPRGEDQREPVRTIEGTGSCRFVTAKPCISRWSSPKPGEWLSKAAERAAGRSHQANRQVDRPDSGLVHLAAPSTTLRVVPLPRFAGEDHGEIVPRYVVYRSPGTSCSRERIEAWTARTIGRLDLSLVLPCGAGEGDQPELVEGAAEYAGSTAISRRRVWGLPHARNPPHTVSRESLADAERTE